MTKNHRCQAKTKSGTTCKRRALPDAKFCYQHITDQENLPTAKTPTAKTKVSLSGSPEVNRQKENDQGQGSTAIDYQEPSWSLIKAGAIFLATYLGYRIFRALTKR